MKLISVDTDSVITAYLAASVGFSSFVTKTIQWPVLGPFVSIVLAALCGSLLAMSISEPVRPRKKMFRNFFVYACLGITSVYIWPHVPGLAWTGKIPPQALSLPTAFLLQWLLLPSIEAAKRVINSYKAGGDK